MDDMQTSKDDLDDVQQLSGMLRSEINRILDDNDTDIATSSIITAMINSLLSYCDTVGQIMFYRDIINALFIKAIRDAKPQQ